MYKIDGFVWSVYSCLTHFLQVPTLPKKIDFALRISSVNATKSAVSFLCGAEYTSNLHILNIPGRILVSYHVIYVTYVTYLLSSLTPRDGKKPAIAKSNLYMETTIFGKVYRKYYFAESI